MQNLIRGVRDYQHSDFEAQRGLFSKLAGGQQPETLFITCSDSRIDPNQLTHTKPGELFVLRNAGNIVPPYKTGQGAEAATIEYAVQALQIEHIVICGHTKCGAMGGLLDLSSLTPLPAVRNWLRHSEPALVTLQSKYSDEQGDSLLNAAIKENVLLQLKHLRTHPTVAEAEAAGKLKLHGWVYQFETGDVFVQHDANDMFVSVRGLATGDDPSQVASADLF